MSQNDEERVLERGSDHDEGCCYDAGAYVINGVHHSAICSHLKADAESGQFICDLTGEVLCRKERMMFGDGYRDIWVDAPEGTCPLHGRDTIVLGMPPKRGYYL